MDKPLRVLIAEDSEDDALLVIRELKRAGYDPVFERIDTEEAMKAALANQAWDIVISDHTMPQFNSLHALKVLQASGLDLPFIIVSGKIGEDLAVAAMKAGANDYVIKGNLARLSPAVERELREVEMRRKRKRAEGTREATVELLRLCNEAHSSRELMRSLLGYFRQFTGCEAVGVRLREGDDFPYYETRGFPEEFVLLERSLCAFDQKGEMVRDSAGHPALDCMCGNILSGRFDPAKPFFTAHGSFWSSCTTDLLASTTDADRQAKTRNRCNGEGYESVALIPLCTQGKVLGLFQFNDKRKGQFTAESISLLEELVDYVAIALAKLQGDEALRESEEHYRSLFNNMLNGFAYCKMFFEQNQPTDFIYLEVNRAFETLTGLKDVVGKRVSEVIPGIRDSDSKLLELYGRVALTGTPERLEAYVKALGMWFAISAYSPQKEYFVAVFDVITERKLMEQELRESEQRFRNLYDDAPVGYFEFDSEGRITRVNHTHLEMLGYTAEEMIGQYVWMFNVEEEIAHERILAKLAGTLPPDRNLERVYRRRDGTTFPVLCQDRVILNERGETKGIRCTIQDITERKRAEENLKQSEEKAQQLAQENAVMAEIGRIISSTFNIDEVYGRFAEEVRKLISFDRISINMVDSEKNTATSIYIAGADVTGRRFGDVTPLKGTALLECMRTRSSMLIQAENVEECLARFPALLPTFQAGLRSIMFVPLISKDQVIGALSLRSFKAKAYTDQDVKLAENIGNQIAGAVANAQLYKERIDAEREKASLEEQFRQSQKLEAVGQLAGGVAHDFNNLLTVIRGYSQLSLSDLKEGDPLVEGQKEILAASNRAADLTRQLLAFSRKQVLEFKVLDLNGLIQGMEKMLRRLIGEDIEMLIHPEGDLGRVKADPGQMEQVILNLAVNSRDAMPSGGKLILETDNIYLDEEYAHRHISVKPGHYVRLSVSDTGCGMAPEVKEKALEPFFTTKEKGKGTGLGLSTVYGIVKQSGGNIWIYSEDGKGTTIKIYLPRVDEPAEDLELKKHVKVAPRGSETVLVVEDEEMVRRLAVLVLKKQGYKVLEAPNSAEAFLVCEQHKGPIDLIVTDVVMPGMSGPEFIDRLRQMRQDFKVLYMSGYTDEAVGFHRVHVKEMAFIQKPFALETLAIKVREVLDKAGKHSS